MTWHFGANSLKHQEGVDPRLIQIAHRALELSSVDFGIPETGGLRSEAVQQHLYRRGKSQADGVHRRSKHQDGIAIDFFAYEGGHATWDRAAMTSIAAAFLQAASELKVSVQWGGHWKTFHDLPHIELFD